MKVIVRAAYDFALWKDSPDVRLRKCSENARKWLFDPSDLDLGFENICFQFDFSAKAIREYAKKLTKEDIKKIELKERFQSVGGKVLGNDE
jgi:hypothetical protein